MTRPLSLVAGLALCCAAPALAQSRADLLARGVRAYQSLDYAAAETTLARSLAAGAEAQLPAAERARALCYLGATELYLDRRDSATAVFRRLVGGDPRYHPDGLVFPPQVTDFFERVRRSTPALAVVFPAETELRPGGRLTGWVVTSAVQAIAVTVARAEGKPPARVLYRGVVVDSLAVSWDGALDPVAPLAGGRYELEVESLDSAASPRLIVVPVELVRAGADTLPLPVPPREEGAVGPRGPTARGLGSLIAGLAGGAAALALPALVAHGASVSGARFAVGAALGLSGLVGLFSRHESPAPAAELGPGADSVAVAQQAAWQARVDSVRALNARRREAAPFAVRASAPIARAGRGGGAP